MKATESLKSALQSTNTIFSTYLSDLSDADLLVRPVPEANHIAWQIGHLTAAEVTLGSQLPGANYPALPEGFADRYGKEQSKNNDPKGYLTKAGYLDLWNRVRQATIETVEKISDTDLDKPSTGRMAKFAPTLGSLIQLISNHTLMHAGQFVVVRRKLGKPILI